MVLEQTYTPRRSLYVRIKRKRQEEPLDSIVISNLKKQRNLSETFSQLSTAPVLQGVVFSRIDTLEIETSDKGAKMDLLRAIHRADTSPIELPKSLKRSDAKPCILTQTRSSSTTVTDDVCFVDFEADVTDGTSQISPAHPLNPASPLIETARPTIILNPMLRELDRAIWMAYHQNDFSQAFAQLSRGQALIHLNVQRPADGLSLLMCAAYHNRLDVTDKLIQNTSLKLRLRDSRGWTAGDFALAQGHVAMATALQKVTDMELNRDYVYDVYRTTAMDSQAMQGVQESMATTGGVAVAEIDPEIDAWLQLPTDGMIRSELELEDWETEPSNGEPDDDSSDSNDENYTCNDYPEEEDSDIDSSDDERLVWKPIE